MSKIKTRCPNCNRQISAPAEAIGRKASCPACHTAFVVAEIGTESGPPQAGSPTSPDAPVPTTPPPRPPLPSQPSPPATPPVQSAAETAPANSFFATRLPLTDVPKFQEWKDTAQCHQLHAAKAKTTKTLWLIAGGAAALVILSLVADLLMVQSGASCCFTGFVLFIGAPVYYFAICKTILSRKEREMDLARAQHYISMKDLIKDFVARKHPLGGNSFSEEQLVGFVDCPYRFVLYNRDLLVCIDMGADKEKFNEVLTFPIKEMYDARSSKKEGPIYIVGDQKSQPVGVRPVQWAIDVFTRIDGFNHYQIWFGEEEQDALNLEGFLRAAISSRDSTQHREG